MGNTDPMRAPFSFSNTGNRFRRKADMKPDAAVHSGFPQNAKRIVRKKKLSPIKHEAKIKAAGDPAV